MKNPRKLLAAMLVAASLPGVAQASIMPLPDLGIGTLFARFPEWAAAHMWPTPQLAWMAVSLALFIGWSAFLALGVRRATQVAQPPATPAPRSGWAFSPSMAAVSGTAGDHLVGHAAANDEVMDVQ